MKKKIVLFSLTSLLGVGLGISLISPNAAIETKAEETPTSYAEYIPVTIDNFNNGNETYWIGDQIRNGNAWYWEAEDRHYGTPYPVIDTFVGAGEGATGCFRSRNFFGRGGTYISFVLGGNPHLNGEGNPLSFVNVWNASKGYDAAVNVHNGGFKDPEVALNTTFCYVQLPEDSDYHLYIRDGANGGFGGIIFGELRVNQTWEELCETFSAHKAYYKAAAKYEGANPEIANSNAAACNYVLNYYATDAKYTALNEGIAALTDANDSFDVTNGLHGWTLDRVQTVYESGVRCSVGDPNNFVSYEDAKWDGEGGYFNVAMPYNKTGAGFLSGEKVGIGEIDKFRFISHEFKLTSDVISAKLGGGTAVLELLDANTLEVLATTQRDHDTYLNHAFDIGNGSDDAHHGRNLSATGTRLNTMTTTYLGVAAHLGKQVRVALHDGRVGGNWGLAYFDEVVTDYATAPAFTVDTFTQTRGEETYHGAIIPEYIGEASEATDEAYSFLVYDFYYNLRQRGKSFTWCDMVGQTSLNNVIGYYDDLSAEAKVIVDASEDYYFNNGVGGSVEQYWLHPVTKGTVAETMAAIKAYQAGNAGLLGRGLVNIDSTSSVTILVIVSLTSILAAALFLVLKKRAKK